MNHNNEEHNHHKYRKQNAAGSLGVNLGSSDDNSKSTSEPLSDNKDSFSTVSIRVLNVSLHLKVARGSASHTAGVPSLVRIPKSDCPRRQPRFPNSLDNYSLLRRHQGDKPQVATDNNNHKANRSVLSNNNNIINNNVKSKSVILLSSSEHGDYLLLAINDGISPAARGYINLILDNALSMGEDKCSLVTRLVRSTRADLGMLFASSSNTLTNSNTKIAPEGTTCGQTQLQLQQQQQQSQVRSIVVAACLAAAATNANAAEDDHHHHQRYYDDVKPLLTTLLDTVNDDAAWIIIAPPPTTTDEIIMYGRAVTVSELKQLICVPLSIMLKVCDKSVSDELNNNNNNDSVYYCCSAGYNKSSDSITLREMNISCNNSDVIEDIVDVTVCYKTSSLITPNVRILRSQKNGIKRTEATMFTVGALSFQDNDKSNKPLNDSFKIDEHQQQGSAVARRIDCNSTVKAVSKSTLISDNIRIKSDACRRADADDEDEPRARFTINIPTMTTCEPTMTLNCQSATVTSQTNAVPVHRSCPNRAVDNALTTRHLITETSSDLLDDNESNQGAAQTHPMPRQLDDPQTQQQHSNSNNDRAELSTTTTTTSTTTTTFSNQHDNGSMLCAAAYAANDNNNNNNNGLIERVRSLIIACQKVNAEDHEIQRANLRKALGILFERNRLQRNYNEICAPILSYKQRWGIPANFGLAGGGESSLNSSGAASWGTAQAAAPNNNNANQSWGGTPGNPPGSNNAPPNNWAGNNVNRAAVAVNPNQNQGPPGPPNNAGN